VIFMISRFWEPRLLQIVSMFHNLTPSKQMTIFSIYLQVVYIWISIS